MGNKAQLNFDYHTGYGDNFKAIREAFLIEGKPCTVRQLSERISISYSTISNIENEERYPTIEQLQKYHDFFGVSYDFLIMGENSLQRIELIDICRFTGLNKKAIEKLCKLNLAQNNESIYNILNKIICVVADEKDGGKI